MSTAYHPWGRVDTDGTVYVRTADGERVIGSWQAGSPEEALAFYQRKYEALETEVVLLEQRINATDMAPAQAAATVQRLISNISDANALGDLDGLRARLERLTEDVGHRREEAKAAREQARVQAKQIKEGIVAEAEPPSSSPDWGPTTSAFRELMRKWKAAGRADRESETELWKRFRAAQDKFFTARAEVFSAKDAALREHAEAKQQLLDQAQALLPVTDIRAARSALRGVQERWEQIGAVPRDSREHLESGLRRVEEAVRKAEEAQWRRSNPEALARAEGTVAQLRATIAQLEEQLAKAHERGDDRAARSAEEALTARRAWLEEAEHTLAEFSQLFKGQCWPRGDDPPGTPR